MSPVAPTMMTDIVATLTTTSSWRRHQSPTHVEFVAKIVAMMVVWTCLVRLVTVVVKIVASSFWSMPIPPDGASIPSSLPHPNPPGSALPFDVPLSAATDEQIVAFMTFRGESSFSLADDGLGERGRTLRRVADCAAAYKGLLYQERTMRWIDDHFRLRRPNLKYPYVGAHWNGWSSFYSETAPRIRSMFISSMILIFEHSVNGLVLPGLYLYTRDELYYMLALYGEVAYMIYASTLILASYGLGRDVTVEQMHEAVWPLLLVHHLATIGLCGGCILVGEGVPKDLVCATLFAMLGFTSSLHYLGQILDFSPLAQVNAPYTRLVNHVFCLASQIAFRGIYWMRICYLSVVHCLGTLGVGAAIIVASMLLLFTLFNVDFVKFHMKATKACWTKIQQEKMGDKIS